MLKYIFVFIYCFSLFKSDPFLYPMEKDSKLGEHICGYPETIENHGVKTYVRPCGEGKYCDNSGYSNVAGDYLICKNMTTRVPIKVYNEDCTSDFDCDSGLNCENSKCTRDCTNNNEKPYKTNGGSWSCKTSDTSKEKYCYYCNEFLNEYLENCKSSEEYDKYPDYLKVEGIMELTGYYPVPNPDEEEKKKGQLYRVKSIESSFKGTVEDGNYVKDFTACKSGFALYFYPDKSLKDPYTGTGYRNKMYLRCVTLIEYDHDNGRIKYSINGDSENIYILSKVTNTYPHSTSSPTIDRNLLTRTELFKKYTEALNNNLEECQKSENYNSPDTCNVDEITKWYYFYRNINEYLFYYAEEEKYKDVIKYLIQDSYHFYQSSLYLNIKYFISLLFLLLL